MEFNEKLQELRKQKGITQEELAECLFVSRTAISKWESGRGFPAIDSLKSIAKFFGISLDELLSSEDILTIAENDKGCRQNRICDLVFGLMDFAAVLLLFLPLFADRSSDFVYAISLVRLFDSFSYIHIVALILVSLTAIMGVLTLSLQMLEARFWLISKRKISLSLSSVTLIWLILCLQPYAAVFSLVLLLVKSLLLVKIR